ARLEVERDEGLGLGAVRGGLRLTVRGRNDGELRLMNRQFLRSRPPEKLPDEQRMPREFAEDADRQSVRGIGASETIEHKHVAPLEMLGHLRAQLLKMVARHRLVDFAPPDARFARRLAHDEFVAGRTAGAFSGKGDERAGAGEAAFVPVQAELDQPCYRQVAVSRPGVGQSVHVQNSFAGLHRRWFLYAERRGESTVN